MRACGAVRPNLQFLIDNFARHRLNAGSMSSTRARQTDIRRVDAQGIHQVQQLDLLFD
jgi:hypothetical protein